MRYIVYSKGLTAAGYTIRCVREYDTCIYPTRLSCGSTDKIMLLELVRLTEVVAILVDLRRKQIQFRMRISC